MSSSSCAERLARHGLMFLVGVAASLAAAPTRGAELDAGSAGGLAVQVVPLDRLRFGATIRQRHDFSCGAAAVATLLTYHFAAPITEEEVFEDMWRAGDRERIRSQGFSLLDLKRFLTARGYDADGFRVSLDELRAARLPAIALITVEGYRHFVVVKGIRDAHVAIGDPAQGTRVLPRSEFEAIRDDVLFVIRSHAELGRAHFDSPRDWTPPLQAPLDSARSTGVDGLDRLLRPRLNEF
jgi:predicted double-glycine peptidase